MAKQKPITKVVAIQITGGSIVYTLEDACREYVRQLDSGEGVRTKIIFTIKTKRGNLMQVTIRDDEFGTVAYGDFYGLSDFLEYSNFIAKEAENG